MENTCGTLQLQLTAIVDTKERDLKQLPAQQNMMQQGVVGQGHLQINGDHPK